MEELILNLLMHSGQAKTYAIEAITSAKNNNFERANKLMRRADEELGYAHNSQSSLIQGEAADGKIEISLLLVHAEDNLMSTMLFMDIANEIIELYEKYKHKINE
ncbi:MAG: PTS lactose/cellobiose transporter subunit IIA [Clostridium butyricum]|nr:PTS lactose/cellobiose transporter subunit IIA [Clostridium butyricum]